MVRSELYTIDGIERAKRQLFEDTGEHLSVTLYKTHVALGISSEPLHPIMLPIAAAEVVEPESKVTKAFKRLKGNKITVKQVD